VDSAQLSQYHYYLMEETALGAPPTQRLSQENHPKTGFPTEPAIQTLAKYIYETSL
jgi:hypothetical protein